MIGGDICQSGLEVRSDSVGYMNFKLLSVMKCTADSPVGSPSSLTQSGSGWPLNGEKDSPHTFSLATVGQCTWESSAIDCHQ